MSRFVVACALLLGCARTAAPSPEPAHDAASALDGCTHETHDGATTWSCGNAFLALDADVPEPATEGAVAANLASFVEQFGKDVVARDPADWVARGVKHRALRIRVAMPEKGRFVATMVIVAKGQRSRVISCSAKESDAARCDDVLAFLVGRAMD